MLMMRQVCDLGLDASLAGEGNRKRSCCVVYLNFAQRRGNLRGDIMSQRLDYYQQSPELAKKLFELTGAVKKGSLGNTLLDLVNIRASQLNGCRLWLAI